jgi:hypothetical protein
MLRSTTVRVPYISHGSHLSGAIRVSNLFTKCSVYPNQQICCGEFYCTNVGVRELSLEKRGVHGKKSLKTADLR